MNLAILGRTNILLETAVALSNAGHRIAIVGTGKASDTDGSTEADFQRFAERQGAPFFCKSIRRAADEIKEAGADLAVSMNWPIVLAEGDIQLFPQGIYNVHAGDLPRYRGNACPNWAILNGEEKIGLCVHKMVPGAVDAGPIALRRSFPLRDDLDIGDVYRWMCDAIPAMFVEVVGSVESGTVSLVPQPVDTSLSLRCYPRRPEDGKIDWEREATMIARLVRASSRPFQGAFTTIEGKASIRIWRARKADLGVPICAVPGQVVQVDVEGVTVACGAGCVLLTEATFDDDGSDALPSIGVSIRNRLI